LPFKIRDAYIEICLLINKETPQHKIQITTFVGNALFVPDNQMKYIGMTYAPQLNIPSIQIAIHFLFTGLQHNQRTHVQANGHCCVFLPQLTLCTQSSIIHLGMFSFRYRHTSFVALGQFVNSSSSTFRSWVRPHSP